MTGNPIGQVLTRYAADRIAAARTSSAGLSVQAEGKYFLVTMHRAENVDREDTLSGLHDLPCVVLRSDATDSGHLPLHPRTRLEVEKNGRVKDISGDLHASSSHSASSISSGSNRGRSGVVGQRHGAGGSLRVRQAQRDDP